VWVWMPMTIPHSWYDRMSSNADDNSTELAKYDR
jgi:hypothetical protein